MPNLGRRAWILWGALTCASLAIRLLAAQWWQSRIGSADGFAFGDSHSYWILGLAIAQGKSFQYGGPEARIMRMPGYPAALGLAFYFWGHEPPVMLARIVGVVLGVVAVLLVAWLAHRLFGEWAGWAAGGLAAIYPGAIAMSVFVLSEALFTPLLVCQMLCWITAIRCQDSRKWWRWTLAAGVLSGLAVLARPSWLLFPIFATGFCVLIQRAQAKLHLKTGLVAIAVMGMIMVPWWWRSYRITGHFVLTTLEMGATLYDGLNPNADGGSNMEFKKSFYEQQTAATPNVEPGRYAYLVDRRMKQAAVQWARENPAKTAALSIEKLKRLWKPWPNAGELRSNRMRWLIAAGFLPLFGLALWQAWRCWQSEAAVVTLLGAPAVYVTLLHFVFVSSIRYRQPVMMLAIVLAGAAVEPLARRLLGFGKSAQPVTS